MKPLKQANEVAQTMNKQRGGTLLGVIIGALLGLGAALAVAVYVTKVPVPFLNKGQPRGADSDAQEAKKNKDWDPNGPLAGKNQPRPAPAPGPAAADTAAAAPVAAASAAKAAVVAAVPATPAAPAKPVASNDPLGDLAKARSDAKARADARADAPPPTAAAGVDPFNYFIQAGAFRTSDDAEQQRAKLSLMGFQAKVTEREQYGRTVYRVRLGPFDKKDEADKTKEKLDGNAVETALVRVQR